MNFAPFRFAVVAVALSLFAGADSATRAHALDYTDEQHEFRAEFPTPRPARLYTMKFESTEIKVEGLRGWKTALPVYGGDVFSVEGFELNAGSLRGKSDLEIIDILFQPVKANKKLAPEKRKIGIARVDGLEFLINHDDGRRERYACMRIGERFFRLTASCADSRPGVPPDPFPSDFVMSKEIDRFFDSFELSAPTVKVGDAAPVFSVKDDSGQDWKSADHVGKKIVVVYFYPADMTGGCTKQACGFRDDMAKLSGKDVEVVGVSGDTVGNHEIFKKAYDLNFALLADTEGKVAEKFGVPVTPGEKTVKTPDGKELTRKVTTARWTFVIDKQGKIALKNTTVKAADDSKAILELVEKLK